MPPRTRSPRSGAKRRSPAGRRSSSSGKRPARRRSTRRNRGLLLLVTVGVLALGAFLASQDLLPQPDGGAAAGSPADLDVNQVRAQLAELTVAEWDAMRGYSRDLFPHWRTVDGCDVRQTVLARDGEQVQTETESCRVVSGSWFSPFDETTLDDPRDVDIDHIVPLANAWRTGASEWDDERRAAFANDLDTPQLIAVSATSNRAKGDQDPSQWQPARSYWCQYAHDWIVVKHTWELTITADERDALEDMLDTCD